MYKKKNVFKKRLRNRRLCATDKTRIKNRVKIVFNSEPTGLFSRL